MKRRHSLRPFLALATLILSICPSLQANLAWELETNPDTRALLSIATNGSSLVAVGLGGVSVSSTDSATWSAAVDVTPGSESLRAIAANSNGYLAVGDAGLIYRRTGGAWDTTPLSNGVTSANLYGVALRSSGEAMIVGNGGVVLHRATSAAPFTIVDVGTTLNLRSVVYADNAWVIGGDDGLILRSTDAVTWTTTQATDEAKGYIQSMTSVGSGVISAVRSDGGIQRSTDAGQTWNNIIVSNSPGILYSVAQNGGAVVAVGSLGGGLLSDNGGTSFVGAYTGQQNNVFGVTAFGSGSTGHWVAVGQGGVILTAPLTSGTNTGFVSLAVTNPVVASSTITSDGTFNSVTFEVENDGLADLPLGEPYTVNLYLSDNQVPEIGQDPVGGPQTIVEGLAAGASKNISFQNVSIGSLSAGNYFLISEVVFTSAGEVVKRTAFTQITVVPNFNLEITNPVLSSSSAGTGENLSSVSAFVSNVGTQSSPSYTVRVYLSPDGVIDSDNNIELAEDSSFDALNPGASRQVEFTDLTIPQTTPGTYFILVEVEANSAGATASATTDTSSATIQIFGPDVLISNYQLYEILEDDSKIASSSLDAGDPFELDFVIRNSGLGAVESGKTINTRVFLSTDQNLSTGNDVLLGTTNFSDGLQSGASSPSLASGSPLFIEGVIPANTISTSYYLLLVTDYNAEVSEQNESNNTVAIPINVTGYNLSVTSPLIPELAEPGETILLGTGSPIPAQVSITAQNVGQSVFDQTYQVELYLSSDLTLGPDDELLAQSQQYTDGLASFGSRVINFNNVTLPNASLGSYFLLSHVKLISSSPPHNSLPDRQASDNTRSTAIQVTGPDLFVNSLTVGNSSILNDGSFGEVSFNLTNQGAGTVPAGTEIKAEIYLSVDEVINSSTDVRLGEITYRDGLASGQILPMETANALTPPTDIPSGIYNMIVVVNASGNIAETGTSSNQVSTPVNIGLLDIQVTPPNLNETRFGVNEVVDNISVNVVNDSGFTISGAQVILYLSVTESIQSGSIELSRATVASIDADVTENVQFANINLGNTINGDVFLISRVILPNGLTDFIPENNQAFTGLTITLPNLAPTSLTLNNDSVLIEDPILRDVKVTVTNSAEGIIPSVANGGDPITLDVLLSVDNQLGNGDILLDARQTWDMGLGGISQEEGDTSNTFDYPDFDIPLPIDTLGGDYFLIFQINRDGLVNESTTNDNIVTRSITVIADNDPGPAFDYFLTPVNEFTSVDEPNGTDGSVLRSPVLSNGETASIILEIEGPTTINVPWRLEGSIGDTLQVFVDDVLYSEISGFDPIFQSNLIVIPEGRHEVEWLFTRGDQGTDEFIYAYVDLDRPRYPNIGTSEWFGVLDPDAKVGLSVVEASGSEAGEEAVLEVNLVGPGLVSFWWKFDSDSVLDSLSFTVDGEVQFLPTFSFGEARKSSILFGIEPPPTDSEEAEDFVNPNAEWSRVAFLLPDGEHTLRWTAKDVSGEGMVATLDGLSFFTPVPPTSTLNKENSGAEYAHVPSTNHDPAIVQFTSNPGTYLLDDANGTGRLPVSITVKNIGATYLSNPDWLSSSLDIHLSRDAQFGGADDFNLGQFSNLQVQIVGQQQVVFSGDLNLPFNLPEGDFYLIARFTSQFDTTNFTYDEFTLANNTAGMGSVGAGDNSQFTYLPSTSGGGVIGANPGFTILRAPDLVVSAYTGPSLSKPYHPEDNFFILFELGNLGLGDMTSDQTFNIRIELHTIPYDGNTTLIKSYPELTQSVFLPAQSPAFPDEWSTPILFQGQLATLKEFLVNLSSDVGVNTPEDAGIIQTEAPLLAGAQFGFAIIVDSQGDILESSETNIFTFTDASNAFNVIASPYTERYDSYIAATSFLRFFGLLDLDEDGSLIVPEFNGGNPLIDPLGDYDNDGLLNYLEYAFVTDPTEARELYNFDAPGNNVYQNGITFLDVPGLGLTPFLTLEFDVNIRANDFMMVVEGSDNLTDWEELVVIDPPFHSRDSLTGVTGLLAHPYVLAVEGNSTSVQQIYSARVLVRDSEPYTGTGSRFMRVRVISNAPTLETPTNLDVSSQLILSWDSSLPVGTSYMITSSPNGEPGTFSYLSSLNRESEFTPLQVTVPSIDRYYQVVASNINGNSEPGTYYPAPPAPDNLLAQTQATGGVQLTWDAPEFNTVTTYRVERAFGFDLPFTSVGTTDTTSFFHPAGATGLYYQVIAINDSGESGTSDDVEASEVPPTNFDAVVTPDGVLITWDLPSDNDVRMVIERLAVGETEFVTIASLSNQHIDNDFLDDLGAAGDQYRGYFLGFSSKSPSGYSEIVIAE